MLQIFVKQKSSYIYIKTNGNTVLKLEAVCGSSSQIGGALVQISTDPVIKPSARVDMLNQEFGYERKLDVLKQGQTYYVRIITSYIVGGKDKDGEISDTTAFTVK